MSYIENISKTYSNSIVLRLMVSMIPQLGTAVDMCLSKTWENYKEKRLEDFMTKVQEQLKTINEECIDKTFLASEEFFDIIYTILQDIICNRLSEKRIIYAKIIKDTLVKKEDVPSIESLIGQIQSLKEKDFLFLHHLNVFVGSLEGTNEFKGISVCNFINDTENFSLEETTRLLYRFAYLGILNYKTTKLTLREQLPFFTTPLFDKLMSYLQTAE